MANMSEEFKKRIEYLEGSFAVAYNVFKEYQPLFLLIFKAPEISDVEVNKQHRNRKQKYVVLFHFDAQTRFFNLGLCLVPLWKFLSFVGLYLLPLKEKTQIITMI